jgi:hypothetical protein
VIAVVMIQVWLTMHRSGVEGARRAGSTCQGDEPATILRMMTVHPDRNPERPQAKPWAEYVAESTRQYKMLLDADPDEPTMQRFFEQHPSFLPGADDIGNGGHHGVWWDAVISQAKLQGLKPNRVPDFMFVRRDTATTRPVCVEIESPSKPWFNKDLTPSAKLTQALDQLDEWAMWFESVENQLIFNRMYVPPEFDHRTIEPVFVLIYGQNKEFRPHGPHPRDYARARRKRNQLESANRYLYTYETLKPRSIAGTYATIRGDLIGGFDLIDLPHTFQTGSHLPMTGSLMKVIPDIADSLDRNPMIDTERRKCLADRWNFWRTCNDDQHLDEMRFYGAGFE